MGELYGAYLGFKSQIATEVHHKKYREISSGTIIIGNNACIDNYKP